MSKIKYLVVSGCSYTANDGTWASSVYWKDDYSKVINLASTSNDLKPSSLTIP